VSDFYDHLADWYHLIFPDWEESMTRQGEALSYLLVSEGPPVASADFRVLDAAAGIGTQALALAAKGYAVSARDLAAAPILRLRDEAERRELQVDAGIADMRSLTSADFDSPFHAVVVLDNAVAHLDSDEEILETFRGLHDVLVPGGVLLCSVRNYDSIERGVDRRHPYGEREVDGERYRVWQDWRWLDHDRYESTMVVQQDEEGTWVDRVRTNATFRPVAVRKLLTLLVLAGFQGCEDRNGPFYQPLVLGRRPK